jgi:hypothetical protein
MTKIKKLIFILIVISTGFTSFAQLRCENYFAQKWLLDFNIPVGILSQSPRSNYSPNFQNPLNSQFSNLKFSPGFTYGVDIEGGCYFGKLKLIGFGTGYIYQASISQISIDNYHIEYQAKDANNAIFRQVVSSVGSVKENLHNSTVSIPLVMKFKQLLNKKVGFSADAGFLVNMSNVTNYSTNSSFNYEAIYSYIVKSNDEIIHVYDNNPTPMSTDWLITKQQYESHNPGGSVQSYFDSLHARGYLVGLGLHPANNSGSIKSPASSLGFIFRPALNIRLVERMYLYVGGFLSYQIFNKSVSQNYRLIDNFGNNYSSLLNTVSRTDNLAIGGNIGIRIFMGHSNVYIECKDDK